MYGFDFYWILSSAPTTLTLSTHCTSPRHYPATQSARLYQHCNNVTYHCNHASTQNTICYYLHEGQVFSTQRTLTQAELTESSLPHPAHRLSLAWYQVKSFTCQRAWQAYVLQWQCILQAAACQAGWDGCHLAQWLLQSAQQTGVSATASILTALNCTPQSA